MKIQELGIIFIIIILPMSLILSVYTQFQIETLNLQTQYDSKLASATYDAIKAFQLNTANSTMSDISNSKIRDIQASVNTFKNSLMSTFGLNGYTDEELNSYIPALVYTMYDGFYIYTPYENTNYLYETTTNADGTIRYKLDENGNKIPIDGNNEVMYGLNPYVPYSCRYKKNGIDIVINYTLDNYIEVRGDFGSNNYIEIKGYLIDNIVLDPSDFNNNSYSNPNTYTVTYNGIEITPETDLKEYVGDKEYPYIKMGGTKYYYDETLQEVFYLSNGTKTVQYKGEQAIGYYNRVIANNTQAKEFYKDAAIFTNRICNELSTLEFQDAYVDVKNEDGSIETKKLFPGDNRKIFDQTNIESLTSNFNQHRLEIIRYTIEEKLSVAIANYNKYSGTAGTGIEFQMPELKEDEWDLILNNITLISFVQGLNIGGKTYNGYSIINNSETKELVKEDNIYIIGKDGAYHKIGDKYLVESNGANIVTDIPAGRLNLDFKRNSLIKTSNTDKSVTYFYPRREDASYNSIITKNETITYDDIYEYVLDTNDTLKKAFYTALARERKSQYKSSESITNLVFGEEDKIILNYQTEGVENQNIFTRQESYEGKFVVNPNIPTKENHDFKGWTTISGSTVVEYNPGESITISNSTTLYPIFTLKQYKIIYKFNGAAGGVEPPPTMKTHDQPIQIKCDVPDWEGHVFLGWSLSSTDMTVAYRQGDIYTQNADITLYAVWKDKEYTIRYNANGGISAPADQIKIHGRDVVLASDIRQRVEYDFIGWSENPTATTPQYLPGGIYSENKDVTLYAVWKRKMFTVTFNATGGSVWPTSKNVIYGEAYGSLPTPTRTGYDFAGWYTAETGGSQITNGSIYRNTGDSTLYAHWTINKYTVTYNANGGTGEPAAQTKYYGQNLTLSYTTPTRDKYIFKGWATTANGGVAYYPGSIYTENKNMTLYAVWQLGVINFGDSQYVSTLERGETVRTSLTATLSGQNRLTFYVNAASRGGHSNVTITAYKTDKNGNQSTQQLFFQESALLENRLFTLDVTNLKEVRIEVSSFHLTSNAPSWYSSYAQIKNLTADYQ